MSLSLSFFCVTTENFNFRKFESITQTKIIAHYLIRRVSLFYVNTGGGGGGGGGGDAGGDAPAAAMQVVEEEVEEAPPAVDVSCCYSHTHRRYFLS